MSMLKAIARLLNQNFFLLIPASSDGSNDAVVARVGDHVTLRCSAESSEGTCLGWTYYPPSPNHLLRTDELELNDCDAAYINRSGRIAFETDGTISVLSITDIRSEDAGQYKCQNIDSGEEAISSQDLVVIGE